MPLNAERVEAGWTPNAWHKQSALATGETMRSSSCLLALALLVAPSAAFFDQIFEQLHAQQGGGGGGGHTFEFNMGGGGGGQAMEAKWPKGVSKKITKKYSWLKATTWDWNGNHVKFEADGSFKAQDQQCQMGLCKWSANISGSGEEKHTQRNDT